MKCKCGGESRCIASRANDAPRATDIPKVYRSLMLGRGRWRRYRCLKCGETFDTIEQPLPGRDA